MGCILARHSTTQPRSGRALGLRAAPTWNCPVLLQIYSPQFAPWLIIEGQPSRAALDRFGTLRLEGSFQIDRLTATEHLIIVREMATLTFALVPESTALRLMARTPVRQIKRRLTRWLRRRYSQLFRA